MIQTENNVFDYLLYYLSHEGRLPWNGFKDAVTRLADNQNQHKPSTYLKSLARLGHIDYDPMNLTKVAIVIAPATLVETSVENRYVLVGSRTPDFINDVNQCVMETGARMSQQSEKYAPTTFVLSDLTDVSFTEIERLGIHISKAFSAKLSRRLPTPTRTCFSRIDMSHTDSLNLFNLESLEYEPNVQHYDNGLYEIPQYGPSLYILKSGTDLRKVPRDWGEWLALSNVGRTGGYVSYVTNNETLCVKTPLNLPLIVDRCATLCSGFPPKLKRNSYCYSDVPAGVAYQITKSIHQDSEEFND